MKNTLSDCLSWKFYFYLALIQSSIIATLSPILKSPPGENLANLSLQNRATGFMDLNGVAIKIWGLS